MNKRATQHYRLGVDVGEPGGRSSKRLDRADGSSAWLPAKCDRVKVNSGDVLHFNTWGGGGWGDPLRRAADLVALDCARGLVSLDGARRYGVVVTPQFTVDEEQTTALRKDLLASRPPVTLFNRGGTIEELKARCKQETSFDPPVAPTFGARDRIGRRSEQEIAG